MYRFILNRADPFLDWVQNVNANPSLTSSTQIELASHNAFSRADELKNGLNFNPKHLQIVCVNPDLN